MFEEIRSRKIELGYTWVKSETGTTYLCPVGEDLAGATDEQLQARCLNESHNPQND